MQTTLWRETLVVNFVRACCAGAVWSVIGLSMGQPFITFLTLLFAFPFIYLVFYLPLGLVSQFLSSKGVPFIGWVALVFGIMILAGDPLTYILHRLSPKLVPVDRYGFINLCLVLLVKKPIESSL